MKTVTACTCLVCGIVFEVATSQLKHRTPKYCSIGCRSKANIKAERYTEVICGTCGKQFRRRVDHLKPVNYCSHTCYSQTRRKSDAKWNNPQYIKQYMKEYNQKHRVRLNIRKREYSRTNEGRQQYKRQWVKDNKAKVKAAQYRYRARKNGLPETFTDQDWVRGLEYWGDSCAYCGSQQGLFDYTRLSADHFVPVSMEDCPGTTPTNILPACKSCNSSKNNKNPYEWVFETFGKRKGKVILMRIQQYFREVAA